MFYSQFILAKKGPLGTIWIAAHLERKLRKNQVADTDIGVSVDSILFPEVPIALRLSSHLLLGVVRIYSRKVNYLFDDCSEALLKIKQAFRSTAVDLPPEESTAPYHSITLPETFDLDDFELPDNDIFQGNYVDHHVSTREQITLQDTMDGVVYSTSQFGLDERFGDGDASQIGLDLDEELLLDKVTAAGHGGISNADPQGSVKPMTPFEEDGNSQRMNETSETTALDNSANQLEGLGVNGEFVEYAEAPSTPGLGQEPNLSCVQEALACDDHMESEDHNSNELVAAVSTVKALSNSDFHRGDENVMECFLHNDSNYENVQGMLPEENGYHVREKEVKQVKLLGDSVNSVSSVSDHSEGTIGALDGSERKENIQSTVVSENVPSMLCVESQGVRSDRTAASPSCSHVTSDTHDPIRRTDITNEPVSEGHSVDNRSSMRTKIGSDAEITDNLPQSNLSSMVDLGSHTCQEDQDPMTSNLAIVHEEMPCVVTNVLKPCSSHLIQPDKSSSRQENVMAPNLQYEEVGQHSLETFERDGASIEVQGDECHVTDVMQSDKNQVSAPSVRGEIHADSKKSDELSDNAISCDQLENINNSIRSELPAPEKLLSVPEVLDKTNDILLNSTPDKEVLLRNGGVDAGNKLTYGRKRSYTESTLTVESLNSSESFGVAKSKKTSESIPDDDDLLSSILVGRRSSVFKLKPTPPAPEVASRKRARAASQTSALKRKVLMDDTMVLHGDIIRQQLTNTEDIRRIRKKAPCTCPEILMIQIQFLEDEIFSETIFTGMSAELMSLHCERYDLGRIKVSQTDENYVSPEVAKSTGESGEEGAKKIVVLENSGEAQTATAPIQTESWQAREHLLGPHDTDAQGCRNVVADIDELETMHNELLPKVSEMNVGESIEVAEDKGNGGDASLQMDVSSLTLEQRLDAQPVEEFASLTDISNEKGVGAESELKAQDELLLEEGKVGASFENMADDQTDFTAPADNLNIFGASSLETGGNLASENGEDSNLGAVNEDGVQCVGLVCDGNDNSISNHIHGEEPIIDTTNSVENDIVLKKSTLNDGDNSIFLDAHLQCATDAEITSFDHPAAENHGEFEDIAVGNDTEFLNVDDDEVAEDYDGGNGHAEDSRLLDNSGWSSRTRAVAKYLQTLFDRETVHGKKVLALDHLLSGKTRKEASRMFFETLVLKTKDYIHVEQAKPLDNISIKPRAKLIKSDF